MEHSVQLDDPILVFRSFKRLRRIDDPEEFHEQSMKAYESHMSSDIHPFLLHIRQCLYEGLGPDTNILILIDIIGQKGFTSLDATLCIFDCISLFRENHLEHPALPLLLDLAKRLVESLINAPMLLDTKVIRVYTKVFGIPELCSEALLQRVYGLLEVWRDLVIERVCNPRDRTPRTAFVDNTEDLVPVLNTLLIKLALRASEDPMVFHSVYEFAQGWVVPYDAYSVFFKVLAGDQEAMYQILCNLIGIKDILPDYLHPLEFYTVMIETMEDQVEFYETHMNQNPGGLKFVLSMLKLINSSEGLSLSDFMSAFHTQLHDHISTVSDTAGLNYRPLLKQLSRLSQKPSYSVSDRPSEVVLLLGSDKSISS